MLPQREINSASVVEDSKGKSNFLLSSNRDNSLILNNSLVRLNKDIYSYIMIVDDEFDITKLLKQGLEKQGFHIFGFTDPLLALEHFQINCALYGLVISDLRMPGMNGYEFVKRVKPIKPDVKIFLSAAFEINKTEFRKLLKSVKIDEFIRKPIPFKDLVRVITKHLNIQIKAKLV